MLDQIGTNFTEVLGWFGEFVNNLVNTPAEGAQTLHALLPIFLLGVSISIILLGVKITRRLMWGN